MPIRNTNTKEAKLADNHTKITLQAKNYHNLKIILLTITYCFYLFFKIGMALAIYKTGLNNGNHIRKIFMFNNIPQKPMTNGLKSTLPRGKWLDEADEVFSYLERHEMQKDSWWKSMGSTLALLKQAHGIIVQSEKRIKEQAQRIKKLEKLSNTDELTRILNRRGFMHEFDRELDRVTRDKSQGGLLIMIDLDNFKSINDAHGHDAGDAALKLVAKTLDSDIRTMDVTARLGGDEFVILFANTNRKQALERAQFLIKKLNNLSFIWNSKEIVIPRLARFEGIQKGQQSGTYFCRRR